MLAHKIYSLTPNNIKIILRDPFTLQLKDMVFNCGQEQYIRALEEYKLSFKVGKGIAIQDAFPFLTDMEREFLLSGITETEWNQVFNEVWEE